MVEIEILSVRYQMWERNDRYGSVSFADRNLKTDFVPIVVLTGLTNFTFIRCSCGRIGITFVDQSRIETESRNRAIRLNNYPS